jgi:hypothetical protein
MLKTKKMKRSKKKPMLYLLELAQVIRKRMKILHQTTKRRKRRIRIRNPKKRQKRKLT